MKTSVSLALFEPSPAAPVLLNLPIEETIPYIKETGYDGVDLFVHDPQADISLKAADLLRQHDLGVGVVMPAALAGQGLFLGHKDKDIREEIVGKMEDIMIYASQFGAMVSLGLVRGSFEPGEAVQDVLDRFAGTIEQLIPCSEKYGVELLVEPINRYEINTLNESRESFDFIKRSGLPLGLMLDTFHMNIEDESIEGSLEYCRDLIRHVHFLDSNRLAPGMGHLDMKGIYEKLKGMGYEGYLCLEALAKPDGRTVAEEGAAFFRSIGLKK
jgi:sugar phosphate isomerase/epimerase